MATVTWPPPSLDLHLTLALDGTVYRYGTSEMTAPRVESVCGGVDRRVRLMDDSDRVPPAESATERTRFGGHRARDSVAWDWKPVDDIDIEDLRERVARYRPPGPLPSFRMGVGAYPRTTSAR